jgi:hypothetical protein
VGRAARALIIIVSCSLGGSFSMSYLSLGYHLMRSNCHLAWAAYSAALLSDQPFILT